MAEQWIIRVHGKDYGPADLATLRDWKDDGRVIPTNPARRSDLQVWQTAAEIADLFPIESPPVQIEANDLRAAGMQQEVSSKAPSRNILTETFRIYFRGFFQFFGLSLLTIVPIVCAQLTSRFIDTAPGMDVDLRTLVAGAFRFCMIVLWLVLWPVYVAGIQILSAELASGRRIGFLGVINESLKYWPRVAGLAIFVWIVFALLTSFALLIAGMIEFAGALAPAAQLIAIALALGLLGFQVWLFCRFFINVLFWQQFAVLEDANAADALRNSRQFARSGRPLPWYQRPLWRGALIVSIWIAFVIAVSIVAYWPRIATEWPMYRDFYAQVGAAQDPQVALQKMLATLPKEQVTTWSEIGFSVLQRFLRPLLGIAFVVLYLDSKDDSS